MKCQDNQLLKCLALTIRLHLMDSLETQVTATIDTLVNVKVGKKK
jgi:hypothetical protein